MSPQLNTLIDHAMKRRESLVSRLIAARMHASYSEAFAIEETLGELDVLLGTLTRANTRH